MPPWAIWLGVTHIWPVTLTPFTGGLKATHGYDPHVVQMHGIFYAWGSGVAPGKELKRVDMIDIHPTVMSLLGLQPGQAGGRARDGAYALGSRYIHGNMSPIGTIQSVPASA